MTSRYPKVVAWTLAPHPASARNRLGSGGALVGLAAAIGEVGFAT